MNSLARREAPQQPLERTVRARPQDEHPPAPPDDHEGVRSLVAASGVYSGEGEDGERRLTEGSERACCRGWERAIIAAVSGTSIPVGRPIYQLLQSRAAYRAHQAIRFGEK